MSTGRCINETLTFAYYITFHLGNPGILSVFICLWEVGICRGVELPTSLLCLKQYSEFYPNSAFWIVWSCLFRLARHTVPQLFLLQWKLRQGYQVPLWYLGVSWITYSIYDTLHARCMTRVLMWMQPSSLAMPGLTWSAESVEDMQGQANTLLLVCVHGGAVGRRRGAWEDMDKLGWWLKMLDCWTSRAEGHGNCRCPYMGR